MTNFTYRKKYDYLLQLHLAQIFEDYHQGKSNLSRNSYLKIALTEKLHREAQGIYLDIPKRLFVPFPKEGDYKIQFTISINRNTEKELFDQIQKLIGEGITFLEYVRDSLYEKMMLEQVWLKEDAPLKFTFFLNEHEDADIISFLHSCTSDQEREQFIKKSLRKNLSQKQQKPFLIK